MGQREKKHVAALAFAPKATRFIDDHVDDHHIFPSVHAVRFDAGNFEYLARYSLYGQRVEIEFQSAHSMADEQWNEMNERDDKQDHHHAAIHQ